MRFWYAMIFMGALIVLTGLTQAQTVHNAQNSISSKVDEVHSAVEAIYTEIIWDSAQISAACVAVGLLVATNMETTPKLILAKIEGNSQLLYKKTK